MKKRIIEIINELAEKPGGNTLASLAAAHDVSQRTIRNDLNSINDFLIEQDIPCLDLGPGGAVIVRDGFDRAPYALGKQDSTTYRLSKEERRVAAAALLVSLPGYTTLATLAENLWVSRATIISDLNSIKRRISEAGLEVKSYSNRGLLVQGPESLKRTFLLDVSDADIASRELNSQHAGYLGAGESITLQKIINEQERVHGFRLTESSFTRVYKYLDIMVNRNLAGEYIEPQERFEGPYRLFANDIIRYVEQYCGIRTTEDEVTFFAVMLSKCRYVERREFGHDDFRVQMLTRQFIQRISEDLSVDLEDDYEFFEQLSNHLKSMFSSSPENFPANDAVRQIVEDHPREATAVRENLSVFSSYSERQLEDNEIDYVIVHVCAAMERKKNREIAFHVILACNIGVGASQLLLESLRQHFNFQVVDIISVHEASSVEPGQCDLIISTAPLRNCPVEHVVVSPVLTDEDYVRLGNKIDALRNSRNLPSRVERHSVSTREIMEHVAPLIEQIAPEKADDLERAIRREVRKVLNDKSDDLEIAVPYLHEMLTPNRIRVGVEATDWRDAIAKSAQPLLDEGYIEPAYVNAMIAGVEEYGPYIVLNRGFALPHAELGSGSIRLGMSLVRLSTPVPFGNEDFDPIEFVCTLSAVDQKSHLKALFNLVGLLQKTDLLDRMHEASGPQAISALLERYEHTLE